MTPSRSSEPLEFDARGRRILTHDYSGYGRGCRCDDCKAGKQAYMEGQRGEDRDRTDKRKRATPPAPPLAEATRQRILDTLTQAIKDGADITVTGIARAAGVDRSVITRRPDLRARIELAGRERKPSLGLTRHGSTHLTFDLPEAQAAAVDQASALKRVTRGQYMREALLNAVAADLGMDPGELDVAGRRAPRRQNRNKRSEEKGADQ